MYGVDPAPLKKLREELEQARDRLASRPKRES